MTFKDIRNKTAAEKRLTLFISDRERGQLNLPKKKLIPTLTEYSPKYLAHCRGGKENTRLLKQSIINSLVKYLGNYPLNKITPFIIEKYRIDRKEKDKIKDSSINIDIAVLSHIFSTAIKAGILDKNPCLDVKKLKVTYSKDRILSNHEIALLFDKLHGKDRLMVLVGLFTGMRLGEVLRLKWQETDLAKGLITFTQSKTGEAVSIPLSDYLIEELVRHKEHHPGDGVFESREITNAVVIRYSEHFSHLFKTLGIQGFTFHNLRHTFSSLLQSDLGVGATVVQGMTGHSSLGMLQKYSHTGLDNKKRAIQVLTDHVLTTSKKVNLAIAQ